MMLSLECSIVDTLLLWRYRIWCVCGSCRQASYVDQADAIESLNNPKDGRWLFTDI
jgi:hypothetical protein